MLDFQYEVRIMLYMVYLLGKLLEMYLAAPPSYWLLLAEVKSSILQGSWIKKKNAGLTNSMLRRVLRNFCTYQRREGMLRRETRLSINLDFRFLNLILWIFQIHKETTSQMFCWVSFFTSLHFPFLPCLLSLFSFLFFLLFSLLKIMGLFRKIDTMNNIK